MQENPKRLLAGVALAALLAAGATVRAQESGKPSPPAANTPAQPPASKGASSAPASSTPAGANPVTTAASATMQIRRDIAGNFLCRFVTRTDEAAPLVPLPAPIGADNVVAVPVPAALLKSKDAQLEVVDADHSRVARLPVTTSGVTPLADSSFGFVQTVQVPVQVRGKGGLTSATVTLASADKAYSKSVLLTPADAGTARFSNVPLNKPVTVTVQEGVNAPVSVTQTLTVPTTGDGFRFTPIEVSWADAKTVPLPVTASSGVPLGVGAPALPGSGAVGAPAAYPAGYPAAPPMPYPPVANNTESPFSGILSTIVSLLFLGGIGYGLYWAYQNGHLKNILDKLGIQTQPVTAGGPQPSPFDKPQRAPVQPITDGTADPLHGFAGGVAGMAGFASAPIASGGPRLVGTMGTYAGQIFPLSGMGMDIGRDTANPIALPDDTNASRRHATLQVAGGQAIVTDNGSSNGTFVNGVRIPAQTPHPLQGGDEVQIGMTRFRFEQ